MRPKFVAGNWKMHTTAATARKLASALIRGLRAEGRVTVAVCPPFPFLPLVGD
ncbi:MAG: triose-phosphate isomerase, partial [Acetobacteraceae bacterium]|nr:triose-phosphate isomerase [Acetobacteraceae bacterium]